MNEPGLLLAKGAQSLSWCSFLQRKAQLSVLGDAQRHGAGREKPGGGGWDLHSSPGEGLCFAEDAGEFTGEGGGREISGRRASMKEELRRHTAMGNWPEVRCGLSLGSAQWAAMSRGHSGSLGPGRKPRSPISSLALCLATAGAVTLGEKGMLSCSDAQAEPDECRAQWGPEHPPSGWCPSPHRPSGQPFSSRSSAPLHY